MIVTLKVLEEEVVVVWEESADLSIRRFLQVVFHLPHLF